MLKVSKVKRGSPAKALGIEVGDEILAVDGFACVDELDYIYYADKENFSLTVKDNRSGEETTVEVEKNFGEDFGVEFEKNQTLKTCRNRCVFCFVDQMPKGMRESLYCKDDDYTMSFTCGNFVTLTNVTDEDIQRIIRLKLSPLYVSVHTLNGELREKLMRNRFAGKIKTQIETLVKGGISLHCQAVIVPGENDGEELAYTARELFKHYPMVKDLACVPTGLTRYREGLHYIPDIDKEYSKKLLALVDSLNEEFGVPFLLPADEYFVKAELPIKEKSFYGEFEQVENGVGLTRKFLDEAETALRDLGDNFSLKKPKKSLWITGVSAEKTCRNLLKKCNEKIGNLQAEILAVKNTFFGETVTCSGLLTGQDIAKAVNDYIAQGNTFDEIVVPGNTLKQFEDVFLCGMTLTQLKKAIKTKNVRVNNDGGQGLINILITRR